MPPGKRRQSNAMLYTLITFVGLFIVATTVAVIYYVKAEELRTRSDDLQEQMDTLVNREESRNIGSIVGAKLPGHSNLGTVVEYLNEMVRLIKGPPVPQTSAEVKASGTANLVKPLIERARTFVSLPTPPVDPNADPNEVKPPQVALTTVITELLNKLDQTTKQKDAAEEQSATLRQRFDDAIATTTQTEKTLNAKVDEYYQQVQQIKNDYNDLRVLVQQNSDERAKTLLNQLEQARAESKQTNQELAKTQAELTVAQGKLEGALAEVNKIKPAPDHESTAFRPDGEIILVDEASGIVHIDLGSDDRVYRGLTFSVYDRAGGIPRNGAPKAQIEVLAVNQRVSTARIMSSEQNNPIAIGDLVANLIWDSTEHNEFVVAGDFDLNHDGTIDYDGVAKIESLIKKWGGTIADSVSADTDYVILGTEPEVPREPTIEEQTNDPMAIQRYNAARQTDERYLQIRKRAESLYVPIFNYDRFLSFTGYANQVDKPGAF